MYQRIAVGLDESPAAAAALDLADALAGLRHGEVTLVSVVDTTPTYARSHDESVLAREARRAALEHIQQSALLRLRRRGVRATGVIREGSIREEVLAAASVSGAELLVIGRASDRAPAPLGTDARHLASDAHCSVLVVPRAARIARTILAATDGSAAGALALDVGRALSTALGARLVVAADAHAGSLVAARSPRLHAVGDHGHEIVQIKDDAGGGVLAAGRRSRAEMVVLGSTGIGRPWGRDLGSTAGRVLRDCPVPVLIVRLPSLGRSVGEVMRRHVYTATAETSVRDATLAMLANGVKALPVVTADRRPVGIITLGDLLRRAGLPVRPSMVPHVPVDLIEEYVDGLRAADRACGEIMTSPVMAIEARVAAVEAVDMLVQHGIKRLPVVDAEGRVAGIVSRADLLRAVAGVSEDDAQHLPRAFAGSVAADVMDTRVPTVRAADPLASVASAVLSSQIGRVAVLDDRRGLVGVVSTRDLLPYSTTHSFHGLLDALGAPSAAREALLKAMGRRSDVRASEVMRRGVVTVAPDTPLQRVLQLMMSSGIKRILVVDASRAVLGAVDRADILAALAPGLVQEPRHAGDVAGPIDLRSWRSGAAS